MWYFLLSVGFTVALYLLLRAFPSYKINNFHAIVANYYACVLTGLVLTPDWSVFQQIDMGSEGTLYTLLLGGLFITSFLLIGVTTQKAGVTASSLAGNLSLVIPVFFGLFVFQNTNKDFTFFNYTGIVLAVVALALASMRAPDVSSSKRAGLSWAIWVFPVLTFIASGTNNTLINYLTMTYYGEGSNTVFMIVACCGSILIGSALVGWNVWIKRVEVFEWKNVAAGFILGVPNFLSLYFLLKALSSYGNSAAFVFPIYNILSMLLSALTAYLLFKEKLTLPNKIGVVIAVVAVVLLSYQELGL